MVAANSPRECQIDCVWTITMPIKSKYLDELLVGCGKPEDLLGEDNPFRQLKKALLERRLGGADAPPG
jgi:hypothetical protein